MNQFTLNLEPALTDRFGSLREFVNHRARVVALPLKAQAAELDMAVSTLSRKLNPAEGDTQRLNCDDLEAWLAATGDAAAVIEYLAAKFMQSDEARRNHAIAAVEGLMAQLGPLLAGLKVSQMKG
jgi:hypothetical protein